MKLLSGIKYILLGLCLLSLVACAHRKQVHSSDINDSNAAYRAGYGEAHTAAYGEESSFGEEEEGGSGKGKGKGKKHLSTASKRIYYFDFDRDIVHDGDKPEILAHASYLLAHPDKKLLVEGHTDPRGSREYNIGLGERRAKAVVAMMIAKGVSPKQIQLVSYGAQKLAALGHNESDYQLNRRVALTYT